MRPDAAVTRGRRAAHTLAEVLVVTALFAMVMAIATALFVWALRTTEAGERRGKPVDEARDLMYRLTHELRLASGVRDPHVFDLLLREGSPYLVLDTVVGEQTQVVAYRLAPSGESPSVPIVERVLYQNDYVPGTDALDRVIAGSRRRMTSGASTLRFRVDPGPELSTMQVEVSITPSGGKPIQMCTRVTMRRSFFAEPDE